MLDRGGCDLVLLECAFDAERAVGEVQAASPRPKPRTEQMPKAVRISFLDGDSEACLGRQAMLTFSP